ncbi:hypothetical protein CMV_011874 [Castanea mollissima]|uniref:Uncharacterized protein n=1 Tax=Castanea mollissima TaxID=60419 RepID=A0A8J4RAD7_9ROSI|nr:hypothetical protein CMV_011874 [Castanea mollissima]
MLLVYLEQNTSYCNRNRTSIGVVDIWPFSFTFLLFWPLLIPSLSLPLKPSRSFSFASLIDRICGGQSLAVRGILEVVLILWPVWRTSCRVKMWAAISCSVTIVVKSNKGTVLQALRLAFLDIEGLGKDVVSALNCVGVRVTYKTEALTLTNDDEKNVD